MVEESTIKQLLIDGIMRLSDKFELPQLEASALLCNVLNKETWYLHAHSEERVEKSDVEKYFLFVNRRLNGEPLQYITNKQEFMAMDFYVDKNVLIPRADTETLVEAVIHYIKGLNQSQISVLDIGTGSGCIAISIAKYTKNSKVIGVDISEDALTVARKNASNIGVQERICFVRGDLLKGFDQEQFDVIVSNPPYIASNVVKTLETNVKDFEPNLALDGGVDGLDCYRLIVGEAYRYLAPGGLLALEIGFDQAEKLRELIMQSEQYREFTIVKDLGGNDRVVMAKRKY